MNWKKAATLAAMVWASLALAACGEEDGTLDRTAFLRYNVNPEIITFNTATLGQPEVRPFNIQNVSDDDAVVKITGLRVEPASADFKIECPTGLAFDLPGNALAQCTLTFTPSSVGGQDATLVIDSNVRREFAPNIQITTQGLQQQIESVPSTVRFTARGGQTDQRLVKIRNVGSSPLVVTGFTVEGQADLFLAEYDTDFYGEVSQDNPLTLMPHDDDIAPGTPAYRNNEWQIFVTYSPQITGDDRAELKITNDTPGAEVYTVPLQASSNAPCILVTEGTRIDFGNSRIGGLNSKSINIQNCGNDTLEITQIEPGDDAATLGDVGNPAHFLIDTGDTRPIDNAGVLEAPIAIAPGQTDSFLLGYAPDAEEPNTGQVYLVNNDSQNPRLELQLFGRGVTNECPTAIARATIRGVAVPPAAQVEAAPLQYLILDGSDSNDQDGAVVDWQWEITQRPDGSVAELESVENEPPDPSRRELFLDLAGTYRISMTAFDEDGAPSCEDAEVLVVVTPEERVHIQLVWNNPEDPNAGDLSGSDIDLHFLKMPIGRWFEQPYDTYFQNRTPSWDLQEEPSLDIDDTDGAGPENINMDDPEPCTWYAVGAHYWRQQFGTAYVTVRIFIDGGLRYESPNHPLRTTNEWWDVARIHWPTGEIFEINETIPTAPRGMPAPISDEMNESGLCGLGN
jgi:hypothetical protein